MGLVAGRSLDELGAGECLLSGYGVPFEVVKMFGKWKEVIIA